jgi:hypothetical protein
MAFSRTVGSWLGLFDSDVKRCVVYAKSQKHVRSIGPLVDGFCAASPTDTCRFARWSRFIIGITGVNVHLLYSKSLAYEQNVFVFTQILKNNLVRTPVEHRLSYSIQTSGERLPNRINLLIRCWSSAVVRRSP